MLGHIAIGDIYQVQLGQEIAVDSALDELAVYQRLRSRNPSPYMALGPIDDLTVTSASSELFLRIGGRAMMRPIAGTIPRLGIPEEDERRRVALRADAKEVAEHESRSRRWPRRRQRCRTSPRHRPRLRTWRQGRERRRRATCRRVPG